MFNEKELDALRDEISSGMSEKRFRHTYEVEKMVAYLGELYMPERIDMLRAAALLHDITKEYSTEEHIRILAEREIEVTEEDICSPKTLHARSAEASSSRGVALSTQGRRYGACCVARIKGFNPFPLSGTPPIPAGRGRKENPSVAKRQLPYRQSRRGAEKRNKVPGVLV